MELIGDFLFLQLLSPIIVSSSSDHVLITNVQEKEESIKFIPQSSFTNSEFGDRKLEIVPTKQNYSGSFSISSIFSSHRPDNKYYKAYKSMKLFGESNSLGGLNRGRSEFSDGGVLQLGQINEPFRGPRRRRRSLEMNKTPKSSSSVSTYLVYSQKLVPEKKNIAHNVDKHFEVKTGNQSSTARLFQRMPVYISSNKPVYHSEANVAANPMPRADILLDEKEHSDQNPDAYLNKAISEAWVQYGTPKISTLTQQQHNPIMHIPGELDKYSNDANQFRTNNSFNIGVPTEPTWHYQYYPEVQSHDPSSYRPFNRVLSTYVDYELNHPVTTSWVKTIAYGVFVSSIVVGWVLIGYALGLIPQSLLDFLKLEHHSVKEPNRRSSENSVLREISTRVALALEGDWLKKLEETVRHGATGGKWIKTHVSCCILPDAKTNGMAECEIVRKSRKMSTFQCLSNLIYNFSFGPVDRPRY